MAVTCYVQPKFDQLMSDKSADYAALNSSTKLQVALLAGTSQPARATTEGWEFVSDATAVNAESTETGYSRQTLTSVTCTTSALVTTLTCANPSWSSVTWTTPRLAIFFDSTGAADTSRPIIAIWDFGGAQSVTGGTFTLSIAAGGLVTWTAAA